jgi:hypothetical protein
MLNPIQTKNRPSLLDLRALSDRALVAGFFEERSWRSLYERIILERMQEDGYYNFYQWVWDTPSSKKISSKQPPIPRTALGMQLGSELRAIFESGCKFEDVRDSERVREFCSPDGNVYHLTERELTQRQKGMLGLIRDRSRRWIQKHSR